MTTGCSHECEYCTDDYCCICELWIDIDDDEDDPCWGDHCGSCVELLYAYCCLCGEDL